jgi:prepilin-type N-terminal cleavage/methylation domain-containing protein
LPGIERRLRASRAGFTLVELLVSIAVLTLMVLFLGAILNHTSKLWSIGENDVQRMENLRAITDSVGNDMRGALLPLDRTNLNSLQFVVNPATITASSYNGDTVFWQAPIATTGTAGDVAEAGYFVKWDLSKPSNPRSLLCRFFVNPDGSFPHSETPGSNYLIYNPHVTIPNNASPEPWLLQAGWLSDSVINAVAPGINSVGSAQAYQGLFAENVIGLWIRCRDFFGQPINSDFQGTSLAVSGGGQYQYGYDSRMGYSYRDPNSGNVLQTPGYTNINLTASNNPQPLAALPPEVDVGVVIIDSQGAARITPAMMNNIDSVIATSSNAASFITNAGANGGLRSIYANLRSYQTEVYLENCK